MVKRESRIEQHPILGPLKDRAIANFTFDGVEYQGFVGEPVAAALLAHGVRTLRTSPWRDEPRGLYCGIGQCYECRVWLGPDHDCVRGCQCALRDGDHYRSTWAEDEA